MPRPDDQILTVEEMRAAEQALIGGGETVDSLMLTAGQGAAEWVWRIAGHEPVTVLCGPGNNGGDGYVIAESLRQRGTPVLVVAPLEPATDAARKARAAYRGAVQADAGERRGAVLVDALFGSGLARPLSGDLAETLQSLSARHRAAVAIDLPSGIESDSGAVLNPGLPPYRLTIALGAWKYAHWLMPAAAVMGARRLVDIGIAGRTGRAGLLAQPRLSAPAANAHKYSRGLLAVIGGAMPGAGILAAAAAMRGGAGYVKLLAGEAGAAVPPELVTEGAPLAVALGDERLSAFLVGPGLGREGAAPERLAAALAADVPGVVDADALTLLAPEMLDARSAPLVATPHEGELARLCAAFGIGGKGKLERARALALASGMVVVAKGPDTLIAAPSGATVLCPPASSWLSVAGTGDVLAGVLASRLAAGAGPLAAACEAVWLHGEAARLAGPVLTAAALAARLPEAYRACL